MSKTKVWIIGAKGRLGSTISDALDRMAYNVLTVREMLLLHPVKWAQSSFTCQQMTYLTDRGMNH